MAGIDPLKIMTEMNISAISKAKSALDASYNGSAIGGSFSSGDTQWKIGKFSVYLDEYVINQKDLMMIDRFFTRYGYAQNKTMKPTTKAREHFTYLKTAENSYTNNGSGTTSETNIIYGHANATQTRKINAILQKGITFWTADTAKQHLFAYNSITNDTLD